MSGVSPETAADIIKALTYTDKSISYQIRSVQRAAKRAYGGGADYYAARLAQLKAQQHVALATLVGAEVIFPTGLLERVRNMLQTSDIQLLDERQRPRQGPGYRMNAAPPEMRYYQVRQFERCLEAGQGTIESATGTGKTVVIMKVLQRLGLKALLVVPNTSILTQTVARFEAFFGKARVSQYGDGKKKIRDITIACAPSVLNSEPEDWNDRQVLIFDECHHLPCATVSKICYDFVPNAFYRFGFTATPFRADGADLAIEAAAFPVIDTYTVQEGIADGFLAKPRFMAFRIKTSSTASPSNLVKSFQEHVIRNDYLNKLVVGQAQAVLKSGKQVLILVKEKEHGHELQPRIPGAVFVRAKEKTVEDGAPWVDPSKAVRDFNAGTIRCLIGTSVIGEGTDILPVDVLIMLAGGASKGLVMQNLGRGLRRVTGRKDDVLVIDYIIDVPQAEHLKRHGDLRSTWYAEIAPVQVVEKP